MRHNALAHCAATNIAVANKKYFNHYSITPYISRISSQMLDFAGFLDYSEILCFQSIFSNRLIFSHICPRKIGKYVGKVSGFTNGLFMSSPLAAVPLSHHQNSHGCRCSMLH